MRPPSGQNHYYHQFMPGNNAPASGASTSTSGDTRVPMTQTQSQSQGYFPPPPAPQHEQPPPPQQQQPPPPPPQQRQQRPYAHMTVDELLALPGRVHLTRLHPEKEDGALWFGTECAVARTISDIIKSYFSEPHANWSQVVPDIKDTWWKMFAQRYNWDTTHNEEVKALFLEKAKLRLNNTVSDWKKKWRSKGNDAKPIYVELEVWNGLVQFWMRPESVETSMKCSASRLTVGPDGQTKVVPHTSGQTPFAGRRLQMAAENGGVLPPLTEVFQRTHKKKDGSFVTPRAEEIWNDVNARVIEEQTQRSQQLSPGGSMTVELSTPEIDRIFVQVAPKNRGKTIGMGSIHKVPVASSLAPPRRRSDDDERTHLLGKIARLEKVVEEERSDNDVIFEIMARENPQIAAILEEKRHKREAAARAEAEADEQRASASMTAQSPLPEFI